MKNLLRVVKLSVCVALVSSFMGCAATNKHTSTGVYVDDTVITTKVKAAIFEEPSLKVFQISVKTVKGEVLLSGNVNSQASAEKAVDLAVHVDGVKSVTNDFTVK